jgi:hypothetical protein
MVPLDPAGDIAVILVAELTVTPVAAVAPKFTAVAPLNPVPLMVTDVPPDGGPVAGLTLVTTGAVRSKAVRPFGVPHPVGPS